jgi:hypothetical protein
MFVKMCVGSLRLLRYLSLLMRTQAGGAFIARTVREPTMPELRLSPGRSEQAKRCGHRPNKALVSSGEW